MPGSKLPFNRNIVTQVIETFQTAVACALIANSLAIAIKVIHLYKMSHT